jgi:hypothetical protein
MLVCFVSVDLVGTYMSVTFIVTQSPGVMRTPVVKYYV